MLTIFKGWFGEKQTQFGMWLKLGNEYIRFHDVIVPAQNGTTQIDHILLSRYGIFVIETKNINGWIFGNEKSKQWIQSLYGKKYKFQNPLHQNYRHTKALASYLDIDHENIHSVVFFIGDNTKLKTELPNNVMTHGLCAYIKSFQNNVLSTSEINLLKQKISGLKGLNISTREHVASLKSRHSRDSSCPKCGGALKRRQAKHGKSAGSYFLGCSNFPKCRYTKEIEDKL
ncbi:MAG: NERD domain-containing protein [Desulfobacteraceae bacterium]|nr:MAG: NERD domain-containing protein [Desulfobacteraceae bacterium]